MYHSHVPREPVENLHFRAWVLARARKEAHFRRGMMQACAADPVFWINTFVWQFNPRKKTWPGEVAPFVTWDFQDEALAEIDSAIEHDDDLVLEKSREMGASWLCLLAFQYRWLFRRNQKFLVISRSLEAVDDPGDPDCLFWKLDHVLKYLPPWMLPAGWVPRKHRLQRLFTNPANGSTITGEASTAKAGVGGRATGMFIDEFPRIDEDFEILYSTSDTTGCRIFNGTHRGTGTAFFKLCEGVGFRRLKKLQMHWTQHPDKNKHLYSWDPEKREILFWKYDDPLRKIAPRPGMPADFPEDYQFVRSTKPSGGPHPSIRSPWYDDQVSRKANERGVAMDLDIDPKGSSAQFFDAVQVQDLIRKYAIEPYWEGRLEYDLLTAKPARLWEAKGDHFKLWLRPKANGIVPFDRYFAGADVSAGTGATPSCLSVMNSRGEKVLEYANGRIEPKEFATLCVAVCRLFADEEGMGAAFAWEMNGPGVHFGRQVIELGYRNVYYRRQELNLAKVTSDAPGWYPSGTLKRLLLEEYRAALFSGRALNRSKAALEETLSFVYTARGDIEHGRNETPDDPTGTRENHADRVIADALMWMMGRQKLSARVADAEPEVRVGSLAWRRMLHENAQREAAAWA